MPDGRTRRLRSRFQELHQSGCFVIPNPWNAGTAVCLQRLGFPAVATTSAGFSFSRGLPDAESALPLDVVLAHIREIVQTVDLPVNADFAAGFAREPEGVASNVLRCIETGVAGLSIEDATGDPNTPLFDLSLAVKRIAAARAAIDEVGTGVLPTGRAECFLVSHPDPLPESIRRLQAYAEAGADVLYAPGLPDREHMKQVIQAVAPKPVNILMSSDCGLTVPAIADLGARRISVGSALARAAWTGFLHAAQLIAEQGSFSGFAELTPYSQLNALFTP